MVQALALVAVFVALFTAPLILGSYVVVQRTSERLVHLWFAAMVGLLGLSLLAAAAGLLLSFVT